MKRIKPNGDVTERDLEALRTTASHGDSDVAVAQAKATLNILARLQAIEDAALEALEANWLDAEDDSD